MDSPDRILRGVNRQDIDPLDPGQRVGEFEVGKLLAIGGMGLVYSATHPVIGKRAAIKVLHPRLCDDEEAVERFVTEARAANQIGHPNIVDVFAFGTLSDGRSYMVMEWLAGESLAQRLQRGPLPLDEALGILDQTADALEAAHEKKIVHRDLKPDNIFLVAVRGGRTLVKLLDFGIAKLVVTDADVTLKSTRPGAILGTPGYLAPEQARGQTVDGRADVYALGCVTFEMLAGRPPFEHDNVADLIASHLELRAPRLRLLAPAPVPADLDDLVARMMEKEAGRRPPLAEVRKLCREPPPPAAPEPTVKTAPPPPRLRRSLALAAAVALTAVLTGLAILLGNPKPAPVAAVPDAPPPPLPQGTLAVTVEPPAQILVDGKLVAESAASRDIVVAPGMHEILINAPGRVPAVRYVNVKAATQVELAVELAVEQPPAAPPPAVTPPPARKVRPPPPPRKKPVSPDDYMLDPFKE